MSCWYSPRRQTTLSGWLLPAQGGSCKPDGLFPLVVGYHVMLVVINQMADVVWLITTRLLRSCELVSGYHTLIRGTLPTNLCPIVFGIQ